MHFRYALLEIANGKRPSEADWLVRIGRTRYSDQLGPFPREYSREKKVETLRICATADLRRISRVCRFPDWLGYMGLVMAICKCDENIYIKTMTAWAWQLRQLVGTKSSAYQRLTSCIEDPIDMLSFYDLETVESALLDRKYG